ncbi:MAG: hypothetical protein ACREF5_01805 [Candidatus Saccharimonadales bacterium]
MPHKQNQFPRLPKETSQLSQLSPKPEKPSRLNQKFKRKVAAGIAAAGLLIGAGAYVSNTQNKVNSQKQEISTLHKDLKANVINAQEAASAAAAYTEVLNSGSKAYVQILYGKLDYIGAKPSLNSIEAPIVLIKNGKSLTGSWLGAIVDEPIGRVVVEAIPFQGGQYRFEPYDPQSDNALKIVDLETNFGKTGVYVTAIEGSNSDPSHQKTLTSPDGSILQPGLQLGMK